MSKTRFLALNELYPYDVILLRRNDDKIPRQIAEFTGGQYSHAAIVASKLVYFESGARGVGFLTFEPDFAFFENGKPVLLADVSKFPEFQVLRHPSIQQEYIEQNRVDLDLGGYGALQACLLDFALPENFRPYPDWGKLSHFVPDKHRWLRWVFQLQRIWKSFTQFQIWPDDEQTPMFCSQLVTKAFQRTNVPLFEDWMIDSKKISPNDLLRSQLVAAPIWRNEDPSSLMKDSNLHEDIAVYLDVWKKLNLVYEQAAELARKWDNLYSKNSDRDKFIEEIRQPDVFKTAFELEQVILNQVSYTFGFDPNVGKYAGSKFYGLPLGQGRFDYSDGSFYEGEVLLGRPHGEGLMHYPDGRSLQGDWYMGEIWGNATVREADGTEMSEYTLGIDSSNLESLTEEIMSHTFLNFLKKENKK